MFECMMIIVSRVVEIVKVKFVFVFEVLDGFVFMIMWMRIWLSMLNMKMMLKKIIDGEKICIEKLKLEMEEYCE